MEKEAVERIKSMVTPKVTIDACYDTEDGIIADIRYSYLLCAERGRKPSTFIKGFTVVADKEGNPYDYPGLFN